MSLPVERAEAAPLSREECLDLLAAAHFGRLAVHRGALPAIVPVNYALTPEGIVFATTRGSELAAATDAAVVAFEAGDPPDLDIAGWSVLVVGLAAPITDPPEVLTARALPLRAPSGSDHFVRVTADLVSGHRTPAVR